MMGLCARLKLPRRGLHRPPGTALALLRGALDPGGRADAMERRAALAFGTSHALLTGSGRGAMALVLSRLGLDPGDEVLLPALTFGAVPETIRALDLVPVFVDVVPDTLQLDPADAASKVSRRSRVLLATHLMGIPCDLGGARKVCASHGLVLLEDFAQAAGALHQGQPVGSVGLAGFSSLETVKPLSAFGGGLITTNDGALAAALRREIGALPAPDPRRLLRKVAMGHFEALLATPIGFSLLAAPLLAAGGGMEQLISRYKRNKKSAGNHMARLHPAQAAAGELNLADLEAHLSRRRRNVQIILDQLPADTWRPRPLPGDSPSWYQLVLRFRAPEDAARRAWREGVDLGPGVLTDLSGGSCPVAALAARQAVQVPCHPGLSRAQLQRVARAVSPLAKRGLEL